MDSEENRRSMVTPSCWIRQFVQEGAKVSIVLRAGGSLSVRLAEEQDLDTGFLQGFAVSGGGPLIGSSIEYNIGQPVVLLMSDILMVIKSRDKSNGKGV